MLLKVECQHCGLQAVAPASTTSTSAAGTLQATVTLPDGAEPVTLCPASTAAWKESQKQQRATFLAMKV